VLTTSHLYLTRRLAPRAVRRAAALGAVMPDAPGIALAVAARARGRRGADLLHDVYRRPSTAPLHRAAHAVAGPVLLGLLLRGRASRALAAGWLAHLAVDAVTHHDDAWPLGWPLTHRVWRSPVSYWQREHHARAFSAAEVLLLSALAVTDRSRAGRLAGLACAALAAAPLLARGEGPYAAHRGCTAAHGPPHAPQAGCRAVLASSGGAERRKPGS
jgi:hypothetical protein